jgi:hypothetical protein
VITRLSFGPLRVGYLTLSSAIVPGPSDQELSVERLFRIYEPWELGSDDYPTVWHEADGGAGVKHFVRAIAGWRCERCGHPYRPGAGEWGHDPNKGYVPEGEPPPAGLMSLLEGDDTFGDVPKRLETQIRIRPPLWSPCDWRCHHGGKLRARVTESRPWEERDATVADLQTALVQGNDVQAAWRILTVHHLNGRKFDLRWWNLAALCQRCHLEIQAKVTMERVWPWEHSEWFKPHAAGWYAYAYLGLDLTREHTMKRLDELLALERMA